MNCRSCNRNLPAHARYCAHCGAEQELPTPIAFAAAMAGIRREAANAVYAESAPPGRGDPPAREAPPARGAHAIAGANGSVRGDDDAPAGAPEAPAAATELDSSPAYANAPSRYRLATVLIVACLVVGAVGLTAAWWFRPTPTLVASPGEAAPTAAPASTPGTSGAASPEATPSTADSAAPGVPAPAAEGASPAPPAGSAEQAAATTAPAEATTQAPVEITPLPPHRAAARAHAAARPATPPPAAGAPPESATPPVAAAPTKQHAVAAAPPAATAAAPVDRWTRMNGEMSRCTREDFIARVICAQRVRFRYCDGYWGKVPACPGSPTPERGQ